eukprot:4339938-Alexandrium_andersonii.AAC.1
MSWHQHDARGVQGHIHNLICVSLAPLGCSIGYAIGHPDCPERVQEPGCGRQGGSFPGPFMC